ncbi:MAG: hypothetical protein C4324_06145 [Blastocatellia bacterium]
MFFKFRQFVIFVLLTACLVPISSFSQAGDAALRSVFESDKRDRDANGKLIDLGPSEHLRRADVYMANRVFPAAREHWLRVIERYPDDPGLPRALFGMGRSLMWERNYSQAIEWFERTFRAFPMTKEGREALAFMGASYVRLGCNADAVKAYQQYVTMYPEGERIESAYLNIIDAFREDRQYSEAKKWADMAAQRFAGKPTEINALHAKLRMEIYRKNWASAILIADRLLGKSIPRGSIATADEIRFLRAFAAEQSGSLSQQAEVYRGFSSPLTSYFAGLAADRNQPSAVSPAADLIGLNPAEYPTPYRDLLLRFAVPRGIDPRFVLAIMKQESVFRPSAKSPAGARGLLQLVYDTAIKFNSKAGFPRLQPDDLYQPAVNIAIGCEYIGFLKNEFGGLYEGIAASYNGGEDNAIRWLNRSEPKEPGIFVAEIGFAETKSYVQKVMNNYRVYRMLYTEDLRKK